MFTLPKLPYEYNALEPFIDEETMHLHHDKHHQAYIDKLNAALEKYTDLQNKTIEELLSDTDSLPEDIRQTVINNGGGHVNHSFFWEILRPAEAGGEVGMAPTGELLEAINKTFGSFEEFKKQFSEKATTVFGSGWAFLVKTPKGELKLKRQSFQNSPISDGQIPILGLDVWEHAYYLKYQNRRAEYIEAWWNVVNWKKAEEIFNSN